MGNNIPQGYKATALGIIPQEWEVMRLGDIVSITSGESPSLYHLKAEGKYPYVKVEDLNNCEKYQESSREYSDDNNTTIKAGSIIFPKRGASILLNSSYKCNGIHINNLFKFFVWCEVSKSFTRSII